MQRQIIHSSSFVGRKKVCSAEQSALSLNPDIGIVCHDLFLDTENIIQIISDYDFILDCTDRFETKFLINDACVLAGKPYSHAGAVGFAGQTMTYVPGRGPCLRCLLNEVPHNSITCSEAGFSSEIAELLSDIGYETVDLEGGYIRYLSEQII